MWLSIALIASITVAGADQLPPPEDSLFPKQLRCTSTDHESVSTFHITDFNSSAPKFDLDGRLLDRTKTYSVTEVSFSNECDNYYTIVFLNHALIAVAEGRVKSVTGLLEYSNAHLEGAAESDEALVRTTTVTCKVP